MGRWKWGRKKDAEPRPQVENDDAEWSFESLTPQERAERLAAWPDEAEDAFEEARGLVEPGFRTRNDARRALREMYDDLAPDGATLDALVDRAWSDRIVEQQGWSGTGDHELVGGVFDALAARGIVGRMDFACCQNCGHAEIGGEVDDVSRWRGYTFFHQQDTARLVGEPAALYLAFGAFDGTEDSELQVATDVADALRDAGLRVDWDGTTSQRIRVVDLRWRRPLPTG